MPPPLLPLPPTRQAPLSSPLFSSPSLPFLASARLPHGQFTAGRGGASSQPGQLRPHGGTGLGRKAAGVQVEVPSGALGAGVPKHWVGSGWAFSVQGATGRGRASPPGELGFLWVARLLEGEQVWWDHAVAVSPPSPPPQSCASSPVLAKEGPRLPCNREARSLMEKEGQVRRGAHFFLNVLPLSRILPWPMCRYFLFSLSRYTGGFRVAKLINSKTDAQSKFNLIIYIRAGSEMASEGSGWGATSPDDACEGPGGFERD